MAPLPPKPSWVTVTEGPEVPQCYSPAAPPWRPAGRKSLTQSQVFLNQASRPSSAPTTASRPSSASSRPPSARPSCRPQSAPRGGRLGPSGSAFSRPSSAPPRAASSTWRGRRYRPRPTTGTTADSQLSSELDSMANPSKFSIYTDHGLSEDENADASAQDAPASQTEVAEIVMDTESEDTSTSNGPISEEVDQLATAKMAKMWNVQVTLGVVQVSIAERPLYAELKMGGHGQCTKNVFGRWPSSAERLTFDVDDFRETQMLTVCFWTSVGEWPSKPRCVAHGKTFLTFDEAERQVTVILDVHQNGQLQRGLAVLHMQVFGPHSESDIFDHGDENCSRNLLLCRRFKGRRFRGIQERPVGPIERVVDVSSRCWSYLEHRSSALKVRRQQCKDRIAKAQRLRAGPQASLGASKLSRVSSQHAFRLQRFLRSFVNSTNGKLVGDVFEAHELRHFLEQQLRAPHLSEDDDAALRALLCEDGQVQVKTLMNFVQHGVTVVPPSRVIYPDEQRARDILKEMFPGFLAKEQKREMELFED